MTLWPSFTGRSRWTLLCAMTILAAGTNSAWPKLKMRPRCVCGIPCEYDYQISKTTPPQRALSSIALNLTSGESPQPNPPVTPAGEAVSISPHSAPQAELRFSQLAQSTLSHGHCAISRIALVMYADGRWRASLQGDQNTPLTEAEQMRDKNDRIGRRNEALKPAAHILRNEFTVVFRGYAAYGEKRDPALPAIGKPLMFRIALPPFWVQRGIPKDGVWDGWSPDVKEHFAKIDRVEVDFMYR